MLCTVWFIITIRRQCFFICLVAFVCVFLSPGRRFDLHEFRHEEKKTHTLHPAWISILEAVYYTAGAPSDVLSIRSQFTKRATNSIFINKYRRKKQQEYKQKLPFTLQLYFFVNGMKLMYTVLDLFVLHIFRALILPFNQSAPQSHSRWSTIYELFRY